MPVAQLKFFGGPNNFDHGWTRMDPDLAVKSAMKLRCQNQFGAEEPGKNLVLTLALG
jgi:hypothetical protein